MASSLINTECKRYGCIKNLLACYANCRYSTRCDDLRSEIIDKTEQASSDINKYLTERGRAPITIQLMKRGLKFSDAAREKRPSRQVESGAALIPAIAVRGSERVIVERATRGKLSRVAARKNQAKPFEALLARHDSKEEKPEKAITKGGSKRIKKSASSMPALPGKKKAAASKPGRVKARSRAASEIRSVKRPVLALKTNRKTAVMPRRSKKEQGSIAAEKEHTSNSLDQAREPNASNRTRMTKPDSPKKTKSRARTRAADRDGKVYIIIEGKSASIVDEQALMMHLFTNPSSGARYFEASEVEARVHIVKK